MKHSRILLGVIAGLLGGIAWPASAQGNQPPSVTLTGNPAEGVVIASQSPTFRLTAQAIDADGTIKRVTFYRVDGDIVEVIGTDTAAPYTVEYTPPDYVSWYYFTAEAVDNKDAVGTAEIFYSIVGNRAPEVRLMEPADTEYVPMTAPASVTLVATAQELDSSYGDIITRLEYLVDGKVIATLSAPNGANGEYVHVWRNVAAGRYQVLARAYDAFGGVGQWHREIVVRAAGSLPTLAITSPVTGESYFGTMPLRVTVAGAPALRSLDVINGQGHVLASWTQPPFEANWTLTLSHGGRHSFTAIATLTDGRVAVSPTVFADVIGAPEIGLPLVILTQPLKGSTHTTSVPLAAEAVGRGAPISRVEFFNYGTMIGSVASVPYALNWTAPATGTYSLSAKAVDSAGRTATTAPISVSVTVPQAANQPPVATLVEPAANKTVARGTVHTLRASASDPDGQVTAIQFRDGTTLLGIVKAPQNSMEWVASTVGAHALRAEAIDNKNATGLSAAVTVTVTANEVPTVQILTPRSTHRMALGTTLNIAAIATDTDGTVNPAIEFYANGARIDPAGTPSRGYFAWKPTAVGTYSLRARAHDNRGARGESADVTVVVTAASLTIDSPAAGATIASDRVSVSGTVSELTNLGVTVNGKRATVVGTRFMATDVPLVTGSNTLEVALEPPGIAPIVVTRVVTSSGPPPLRVVLDEDRGIAPFTTTVRLQRGEENINVASLRWTTLDGATYSGSGINQEVLGTLTLSTPRVARPTIEITDDQGRVYTQTLAIAVERRTTIEDDVRAAWAEYTGLLRVAAIQPALNLLPLTTAVRYKPVLDALAPHFATIIGTWSAPVTGLLTEEIVEFTVSQGTKLYFIYLVRDGRGVWRIDSM